MAQHLLKAVLFSLRTLVFGLAALALTAPAQALSLGSAELNAAQRLGCVLADDALGYLSEDQFNRRFDAAVEGFGDEQVDVIYAKALGYIDGLLFGLGADQQREVDSRLQSYSSSGACAVDDIAIPRTVSL